MRELERRVVLSVLDRKWREHLYEMDYLREGIYLRAYAQRDPLVEYQREGFDMFAAMMDGIKEESVGFLFNLEVQVEEEPEQDAGHDDAHEPLAREFGGVFDRLAETAHRSLDRREAAGAADPGQGPRRARSARSTSSYSAPQRGRRGRGRRRPADAANADDEYAGVGRNADCPCGSGKKYKQCHGAPGGPTGLTARQRLSGSAVSGAVGDRLVERVVASSSTRLAGRARSSGSRPAHSATLQRSLTSGKLQACTASAGSARTGRRGRGSGRRSARAG